MNYNNNANNKTEDDDYIENSFEEQQPLLYNCISPINYTLIQNPIIITNNTIQDINPFMDWEYDNNNIPNDNDIETDDLDEKKTMELPDNEKKVNKYKQFVNRKRLQRPTRRISSRYTNPLLNNNIYCPECNIPLDSESSLSDHYIHIHHMNIFQNNYTCQRCGEQFLDGDDLDDHLGECMEIDNIPINPNGQYECPICKNKYSTAHFLGEHFIISHNNYSELTTLDKKHNVGFPGFDILKQVGMIKYLNNNEIKNIINSNTECNICYNKYQYTQKKVIYNDNSCNGYNSDSELYYKPLDKKTLEKQNKLYDLVKKDNCNRTFIKIKRKTNFKELIDFENKLKQKNTIPCVLVCCNIDICKECLQEHTTTKNKIICPYCNKNYEDNDLDYIKVIENGDQTNNSWKRWWVDKLNILHGNLR